MSGSEKTLLLADASPLISFLKIDRFDLLANLGRTIACTDFVKSEVLYPRSVFEELCQAGKIVEIAVTEPAHHKEVDALYQRGLGRGEASSIILAAGNGYELILDDKKACREALSRGIFLYSTADIVVWNIKQEKITLEEANGFIGLWRTLGEFPVRVKTFNEFFNVI
ncbi:MULTISPECIES: hypothetical protein [Cyanophyceae]|uniref:Nucleic acid-binding protein, contains PIN domain n=1 Tax=Leptolyngbya subtilissima DQ-A4 TaxID=2933933 RepID=A0ABV0KA66_9CYAN|nr:hypothetical protein [Nodosilinea sp. FACHB-141]MBD2115171.1 hypothetical protein [Nodosilinea sp. FACHB-141]